jgi:hypothetical protein
MQREENTNIDGTLLKVNGFVCSGLRRSFDVEL